MTAAASSFTCSTITRPNSFSAESNLNARRGRLAIPVCQELKGLPGRRGHRGRRGLVVNAVHKATEGCKVKLPTAVRKVNLAGMVRRENVVHKASVVCWDCQAHVVNPARLARKATVGLLARKVNKASEVSRGRRGCVASKVR